VRIKIDENLPQDLGSIFQGHGHDVDSVIEEGLTGRADDEIWSAALAAGRALVTSDLDFSDIRRFQPGTHPGIVLFRDRVAGRAGLLARFADVLATHDVNDWSRCFVVISAEKIRIRRPSGGGHERT
jgi:hypothetical protein